ncbi:MAG: efflux RND transporter permease subunit [Planctomycetota bacterium]
MKRWIEWFADNSVAANLLMVLLVVGGVISGWNLRKEVTPEIDTDIILVQVPYPGATPAEIEESICARIEEQVEGLSGIKKVTSTAAEGMGSVMVELMLDSDGMKLLNDIKTRVDAIPNFPEEAEKPIVQEIDTNKQVVTLAVVAETGEADLKALGERVRDEVSALPKITKTALVNVRPYEVSIEVSEARLEKYGLAFDEVVAAVRASSLDLPAGSIKAQGGEILLRSLGQAFRGHQFEQLVLRAAPDGRRILLGDVATVRDAFEDQDLVARFNGKPAVMIQVFRVGEQSAFEIVGAVEEYLAEARNRLPDGAKIVLWRNDVDWLEKRLGLLLRNGWQGFILVFATLALFLRFQLAFWVTLGIPFAFLGALWLLPALDVTINMISLFGFIIVLGIVVDDAIVVGENVFTRMERGERGLAAARAGTIQMIKPVSFAVLTTIAAFLVMLGIPGIYGQFARNIPLVVIACLCFSLIEAFFVLPAHLKHMNLDKRPPRLMRPIAAAWTAFQSLFQRFLDWLIHRTYAPALELFLRWRYATWPAASRSSSPASASAPDLSRFFPQIDSSSCRPASRCRSARRSATRATASTGSAGRARAAGLGPGRDVAGQHLQCVSTTLGIPALRDRGSARTRGDGRHPPRQQPRRGPDPDRAVRGCAASRARRSSAAGARRSAPSRAPTSSSSSRRS